MGLREGKEMAALPMKQARSLIRRGISAWVGSIFLVLSVGCSTTLTVDHLATGDSAPLRGVNYFLPFTQFELTVSRTLTSCPPVGGNDLTYKTQVVVVSYTSQPDPTQEYQIDLTTLSNFWKTSDLKISLFPGGMLQSFNATASDQTAQIYQNVLSGVGEIAATVATGGLAPAPAPQQT